MVQVREDVQIDGRDREAWFDVATVTVPGRTKRKTVLRQALEEAGLELGPDKLPMRVLSEESAEVLPVGMDQPPPQLTIG